MSLIRQRRKNLIKAGMLGAFISLVVFGCFLIGFLLYNKDSESLIDNQSKKEEMIVYKLVNSLEAGEIIKEDNLLISKIPKTNNPGYSLDKSDLIGETIKASTKAGTIITKDLIDDSEAMKDDMRLIKYEFVKLTEKLGVGDYIDIRISFVNGADFILLSKKRVEDLSIADPQVSVSGALWLKVTEEELLRVSSAIVDAYLNEGCKIYAIEYLSKKQKEAVVNYPVNELVEKLIAENPNIITKAKNVLISSLRSELELDVTPVEIPGEVNTSMEKTEQEEIGTDELYENEEIEYLD